MISRKKTLQCIVILLFMFGYNLHVAMGQHQIGRNSPQVQPSQNTTPKERSAGKSTQVSPAVQSNPQLTKVENRGCIYPGTILKLKGRNLGKPGSYDLYLKTSGKQVDLTAAAKSGKWTTTQIQLQLPRSIASGLARKEAVRIGFQQHIGRWLTSVKFDLCLQTKKIAKPSQTKPQLLKVENKGCVSPGDTVRLKGRNLGKPGSYDLYLKTSGKQVDLTAAAKSGKWTTTQIQLQLPRSIASGLARKESVRIGFQQHIGRWLTSVKFDLCSQTKKIAKPSQTKPQLLKVENEGCVSPSDIIRLKGYNLGKPGNYNLYLQTDGKKVDVTAAAKRKKWSSNRIELQLPLTVAHDLHDGGTVRIGFLNKKGSWLDSVKLNLCKKIDTGPDDLKVKKGPFTTRPDLVIKSIGAEKAEDMAINIPPYGYSMVPAINYVFTVGNIGQESAGKNTVFIECFGPNGGECPYGLLYKDGIKRTINLTPAPHPDFHISNSQQKITVGPFPLIGRAIEVTWRVTVDAEGEVFELREDNNMKTFSYREPRTDLFSILTLNYSKSSDTIAIVPDFQLFSGYYEDDNQESYESIVPSGPNRVLFECFSKSGFKCPPEYPVSVEVGYLSQKYSYLCKKWDDCQEPQVIGHHHVTEQDLLATKTEWLFKTTVDADNIYPEMDENNNVEYASISWAGDSVKVADEKNKSQIGVAQKNEPQVKELPPVIDYFMVIPAKSPVLFPLGTLNPGSTVLLGGKGFPVTLGAPEETTTLGQVDKPSIKPLGSKKIVTQDINKKISIAPSNKIFLFGDFGVRELQDVKWISEEKAQGVVPNDIIWPTGHTAYLRIVRKDGEQSPPKDINFFPALDSIKLDLESGKQVIKVVRCGDDSNKDTCNGKVYHSQNMSNTIIHGIAGEKSSGNWAYNKNYPMQGSHANVWGAVSNDVDYDVFKIELKNGWTISKVDFEVKRFEADAETQITSHTQSYDAIGKSEWTARVDWQVDEGAEAIWYGYSIEIAGPVGTSPF